MAIYEENGFWHFRIALEGREHSGTTGIPAHPDERAAAEQFEKRTHLRLIAGEAPIIPIRFADAVGKFLEWGKGEYPQPNTLMRHETSCKALVKFFADKVVHRIGPAELEQFKTWRRFRVQEVTIRHDLFTLSVFFAFAIVQNWAVYNPVRKIKLPSDKHSYAGREITPEEERKYFQCAAYFYSLHDFTRMLLDLGLRPNEAATLRKEDFSQVTGQIQVRRGKTKAARRSLALTPECLKAMQRRLRTPGPWLFPGVDPEQHAVKFNSQHYVVLKKTGLRFRLYDLRHTFATRKARSGVAQTTLAALLGHGSTKILLRYVHPSQTDMNSAMHVQGALLEQDRQARQAAAASLEEKVWGELSQLEKHDQVEIVNAAIAQVISVGLPTGKEGHARFREFLDDAILQAFSAHRKRRWNAGAGVIG